MVPNTYQALALRTESHPDKMSARDMRICHAVLGLTSELSELEDAIDKCDDMNIAEECGDILWYSAVLLDVLQIPMGDVLSRAESNSRGEWHTFGPLPYAVSVISDKAKRIVWYGSDIRDESSEIVIQLETVFSGINMILSLRGLSVNSTMSGNIAKLRNRYPEKFQAFLAMNHDVAAEMEALEGGL